MQEKIKSTKDIEELNNNSDELSRTMKGVIEKIIASNEPEIAFNENELLFLITDYFVSRFPGNKLEYQLKRMGMETTSQIRHAIGLYMSRYACTDYPNE